MTDLKSRRLFVGALVLIFAAGLALRFYRFPIPGARANTVDPLAALPPGLDSDEAFHTLAALRLTRSDALAPFFKIDQGIPAAMIYLIALIFQFTGPVAEAGRLASAITGAFVLVALPFIAARLFSGWRAAVLFTAAQTAFTFWFVNFSRIGLEQMTTAALITLAVGLFWLWQSRGGWGRAVPAGVGLGLALYSYPAAYFLPSAILLYAVYACTLAAPRWKPNWRELIFFFSAFALAAAPLLVFFANNPDWAARRSTQVAAVSWMQSPQNLAGALGGLLWRGDEITRHNIPGRPLLDPIQSIFFVVGIAYCVKRWRETPSGLLLIWFGVMLAPAVFSANPQHFGRLVGSIAAVMLIAGVGAASVWRRIPGPFTAAALAACVLFSLIRTGYDYFVQWPKTPDYLGVFDFPERVQAEAILEKPGDAAYLSPSDRERSMFAFFWQDEPRAQSFNGRVCSVAPTRTARETIWLINVLEDTRTPERLAALYPVIENATLFADTGTVVVSELSLPVGLSAQLPDERIGRVDDLAELIAARAVTPPAPGASFHIELLWRVSGITADNWTVGLYLLDGASQVHAQDDRQPCDNSYLTSVWQVGELIVEDRALDLPTDLPSGAYTLGLAFYRLSNGERLPVFTADGAQDTLLRIASLSIP